MKSAFLISENQGLRTDVREAFLRIGGRAVADGGDFLQLRDADGRLLSVSLHDDPETDWEFREGPFVLQGNATLPNMSTVTACVVECRWEDLFVSVVARLAAELPETLWVLDSNDGLWLAAEVDPERVAL